MKVRIKFKKYGPMKFIGHLDIMRYFQKCMRRAEVNIAYTTGFSPHQIMSFAAPLGVGLCSEGEYFDIELQEGQSSQQILESLNQVMVPGMEIISVKALKNQNENAMASVAAAKYFITFKEDSFDSDFIQKGTLFFKQDSILVTKKTKKNEISFDLKPHIYHYEMTDVGLYLFVDASSSGNIKPTLVLEALCGFCNVPYKPFSYQITRLDTYTNTGGEEGTNNFVPLDMAGVEF